MNVPVREGFAKLPRSTWLMRNFTLLPSTMVGMKNEQALQNLAGIVSTRRRHRAGERSNLSVRPDGCGDGQLPACLGADADGRAVRLGAGETVFVAQGTPCAWDSDEHVAKVYVVQEVGA